MKEFGPDHDKLFTFGVFLGEVHIASGDGKSKQEAETQAAYKGVVVKKWGELGSLKSLFCLISLFF